MTTKNASLIKSYFLKGLTSLLFVWLTLTNISSSAQDLSGREFWFTFPKVDGLVNGEGPIFFILSDYCIDNGLIEFPALNHTITFNVQPGQYTQIAIPAAINGQPYNHTTPNKIEKKGIRIRTPFPVTIYAVTYSQASVDGEVVAPIQSLGTKYVPAIRGEVLTGPIIRGTVVATEDTTTVTFKYWRQQNGKDTSITVKLNMGETYQIGSNRNVCQNDIDAVCWTLDGAVITSDKPIALVNSADCANTNDCGPCDNMMTMPLPVSKWGSNYTLAQGIQRDQVSKGICNNTSSGDWYQIMGQVGTVVKITDRLGIRRDTIKTIPWNNGANYGYGYLWGDILPASPIAIGNCDMVIEADAPVQVLQYQKSYSADNNATTDPESVVVYPINMWKPSYLMGSLRTATTTSGFITVVLNDVGSPLPSTTITRNGINIGTTGWVQIGATTWKYNRIAVVPATTSERFVSTGGYNFGIYSASLGAAESFSFQGGLGPILTSQCPTCPISEYSSRRAICIGQPITFTDLSKDNDPAGLAKIVKWIWEYGDGTRDSLSASANPTHTYATPGIYYVKLTVTNNAIPICSQTYEQRLVVGSGPKVNAGLNDTICIGDKVTLGGNPTISGGLPPYKITWTPSTGLSSPSATNPVAQPTITTDYKLSVIDSAGCDIRDTVQITVLSKDSIYFDTQGTICLGDSVPFTAHISTPNGYTFTVVLNDGTSNRTYSGLRNNDVFYVHPASTRSYKIVDFHRDDNKPGCFLFTGASYAITVKNIPTASFGAGGTICQGGTFSLQVNIPSTDGAYNFTYTDPNAPSGSTTKYNQSATPVMIPVSPSATTTYKLTGIEYANAPKCTFNPNSTVTVTVVNKSNPGVGDTLNLCKNGSPINLNTTLTGTPQNGTWSELDGSGILSGNTVNPSLNQGLALGSYRYQYTVKGTAPCPDTATRTLIKIVGPPTFANVVDKGNCDSQLQFYKVTARILSGDPSTYSSPDGSIVQSGNSYNFTSTNSYATKSNYTIRVDDANGCGPTEYKGYVNCGCKTSAGNLSDATIQVCETQSAAVPAATGSNLLNGDTMVYVLHEGSGSQIIGAVAQSNSNVFSFLGTMTTGKTYYVSTVAGPKASYGPDSTSDCYTVAAGTPVIWQKQPSAMISADVDKICGGNSTNLKVVFFIGTPVLKAVINGTLYDNLTGNHNIPVSPVSTTTYNLDSIYDAYCAVKTIVTPVTITVNYPPTIDQSSKVVTCNNTATGYSYSFNLSGGDPSTYQIISGEDTIIGNTYSIPFVANNDNTYNVVIDDANGCGPVVDNYVYTCPCITSIGSLSASKSSTCETDTVFLNPVTPGFDGDDGLVYILHSDSANPYTPTPLAISANNYFTKKPGMVNGTKYFVTAVAGNLLPNGTVDTTDRCIQFSNTVSVVFTANPTATLTIPTNVICNGSSTNLVITPSYSGTFQISYAKDGVPEANSPYTITPSSKNISVSPSGAGTYFYSLSKIVNTATGCQSNLSESATVTVNAIPTVSISSVTSPLCELDQAQLRITFTGTPDFHFNLVGPTGTIEYFKSQFTEIVDVTSVVGNNTYRVETFSDQNCPGANSNQDTIIKRANPTGTISSNSPICYGDIINLGFNLTGTGPFDISYQVNGNPQQATGINSGHNIALGTSNYILNNNTYQLDQVKDISTGCSSTIANATSNTQVNALPTGSFGPDGSVCVNHATEIELIVNGAFPIDATVESNTTPAEVIVLNGILTNSQKLLVNPNTTGIVSYSVTSLSLIDNNQCVGTVTDQVNVDVLAAPITDIQLLNNMGCVPIKVDFLNKSIGTGTCVWHIGYETINDCSAQFTRDFRTEGTIPVSLTVTDASGCSSSDVDSVYAYAIPKPDFDYSPERPTFTNNQVQFINHGSYNCDYTWYIDALDTSYAFNPVYTFPDDEERTYNITLIAVAKLGGCTDTIDKSLTVHGEMFNYIPNSFTPNGDGVNDQFLPVLSGGNEDITSFELFVVNRWGTTVFYSEDSTIGWDGKFEGKKVPEGVYGYRLRIRSKYDAEAKEIVGTISIINAKE